MKRITSGDAEICYEVLGSGPPVVLLHPFPANHEFWRPVLQALVSRILKDPTLSEITTIEDDEPLPIAHPIAADSSN